MSWSVDYISINVFLNLDSLQSRRSERFLRDRYFSADQRARGNRTSKQVGAASLPMPQVFHLAQSFVKGKPGETHDTNDACFAGAQFVYDVNLF